MLLCKNLALIYLNKTGDSLNDPISPNLYNFETIEIMFDKMKNLITSQQWLTNLNLICSMEILKKKRSKLKFCNEEIERNIETKKII